MSEFSPQFEKYIDPAFWGGHMIGDGDPKPFSEADFVGQPDGPSTRHAREVLEEVLPQMQELSPIQRFESGMLFDAAAHDTGTVVAYKRYSLVTIPPRASRKQAEPGAALNAEPFLELNLGYHDGFPKIVTENGLSFCAKTLWGVVSKNRKGNHTLVSFSQSMVYRTTSASVAVKVWDLSFQPSHFRINNTNHRETLRGRESLDKVSQLYICGYGKTKKARKTGIQLVNNLIPRPTVHRPNLGFAQGLL